MPLPHRRPSAAKHRPSVSSAPLSRLSHVCPGAAAPLVSRLFHFHVYFLSLISFAFACSGGCSSPPASLPSPTCPTRESSSSAVYRLPRSTSRNHTSSNCFPPLPSHCHRHSRWCRWRRSTSTATLCCTPLGCAVLFVRSTSTRGAYDCCDGDCFAAAAAYCASRIHATRKPRC